MSAFGDGHEYIILNAQSGTAMDLGGGRNDSGGKVVGWDLERRKGGNNQIWKAQFTQKDPKGYQWCTLTNRMSGTNLTMPEGEPHDGTPLSSELASSTSHHQQWLFWPVPNGNFPTYVIYNRATWTNGHDWHCADLARGIHDNGTKIQIWKAGPVGWNPNQAWMLIKLN